MRYLFYKRVNLWANFEVISKELPKIEAENTTRTKLNLFLC
jgi:hypothetical protein